MNPTLTIAIQSYKNTEMLKVCLNSVRAHVGDLSHEIIVADGETGETTETMMREDFPEVRFYPHERNVGFSTLVNKCLAESRGDYVLLLNPDTVVMPQTMQKLLSFLQAHPEVGVVGPLQRDFNGVMASTCFRFYKPWTILYRRTIAKYFNFAKRHLAWFEMQDYDHQTPRKVDWLLGSALMVSRPALEKVGGMDERFFMYMEDVDWCRRFWHNGYDVVYYPDAEIYHYYGKGSRSGSVLRSLLFNRLTWVHIASACKYFKKYSGQPLPHYEHTSYTTTTE